MKILVESGATKSDWRTSDGQARLFPGMNVSTMPLSHVLEVLSGALDSLGGHLPVCGGHSDSPDKGGA